MEGRILLFPLAAALVGAALGYAAARWIAPWAGWALAVLGLGGAVWLVLEGQGRAGMEGLGYVVIAMLMLAPAGLGAALGTLVRLAGRARAARDGRKR
jgi:hypothetical protein